MSTTEQQDRDDQPPSQPRAPRTNLLLAATIDGAFGKAAVRVRNLSEGGAMLEGASLPAVGEPLTLRRGELDVTATVVWLSGNRCGVRFDRRVSVTQWAGRTPTAGTIASPARPDRPAAAAPSGASDLDHRLAEEIGYVVRLLLAVENELADEPLLIQRHAGVLQNFDLAAQVLGHLAAVLDADDRNAAINAIGMTELRARLLRKANF